MEAASIAGARARVRGGALVGGGYGYSRGGGRDGGSRGLVIAVLVGFDGGWKGGQLREGGRPATVRELRAGRVFQLGCRPWWGEEQQYGERERSGWTRRRWGEKKPYRKRERGGWTRQRWQVGQLGGGAGHDGVAASWLGGAEFGMADARVMFDIMPVK
ncbi:uncharacterized protein [Triticum aestivum]|uniref:uncharacterized protein n=1 Tax=Triticum aestivum TaxID=4565 RepID=UPI001D02A520|nr:uncharacterized protein LOC123041378 [Triticum aestivum]